MDRTLAHDFHTRRASVISVSMLIDARDQPDCKGDHGRKLIATI
jgi:hypothetical protein